MKNLLNSMKFLAFIVSAFAFCAPTYAADWPDNPITLVVPFSAGGLSDSVARKLAQSLSKRLNQHVIVVNKPGAGGMIAAKYVAMSKPDGYTVLLMSSPIVLDTVFYKHPIFKLNELQAVSLIVTQPGFLAVNNKVPAHSVEQLIDLARKKPGSLTCGHAGIGSSPYLSCLLFSRMAKVDLTLVPYNGNVDAVTDVIAGRVSMVFASEALTFIQNGQLTGLGVTSTEVSPAAPNMPPVSNTVPGFKWTSWLGVSVPKDTPPKIVAAMDAAIKQSMADPSWGNFLKSYGANVGYIDSDAATRRVNAVQEKWQNFVKVNKITIH